jgi:hypothetical protein
MNTHLCRIYFVPHCLCGVGNDLDLRLNLARVLEAPHRIPFQCPKHHLVQPHVHAHLLRRRGEPAQRQFAGQHFVKHHPQRVNVGTVIDRLRPLHLLRRHVVRRAHDLLRAGQRVRPRPLPQQLRQAEVRDLHPAFQVHQDVFRLDVAVHDPFVVGVLQRLANLRHDRQRLLRLQVPGPEHLPQVCPVHELHEEVIQPAHLAEVVDRDDARVAQARQGLGYAGEPLGERRVGPRLGGQDLQGCQPVELRLPDLVHGPHPALADQLEDFQPAKELRQVRGIGRDKRRPGPVLGRRGTLPRGLGRGRLQAELQHAPRAHVARRVRGGAGLRS